MPISELANLARILFWYIVNILVVLSNKYLLSNYGFKYPVFLTGCHLLACALMGYLVSFLQIVPRQHIQSKLQLLKITLLASVFCASVVLGNVSLRFIPVSFNQAIGATTPFFTAIWSFCCLGRKESFLVYLSLLPIVLGMAVAAGGEPMFNLIGFAAAIAATCGRAFKSVLQGLLLTESSEKLDSINLLTYMAPLGALLIMPAILVYEHDALTVARQRAAEDHWFLPALLVNASLAFLLNLSNFMVTKHTSALTLQVLGNAKGVVAAIISVLVFMNPISLQGGLGYGITLLGIALYSQAKRRAAEAHNKTPHLGKQLQLQAWKLKLQLTNIV